jgi:hypothetical protein
MCRSALRVCASGCRGPIELNCAQVYFATTDGCLTICAEGGANNGSFTPGAST